MYFNNLSLNAFASLSFTESNYSINISIGKMLIAFGYIGISNRLNENLFD